MNIMIELTDLVMLTLSISLLAYFCGRHDGRYSVQEKFVNVIIERYEEMENNEKEDD